MAKGYWLMKTEPSEFSIDDLSRIKVEPWTGVRNYQARNYMKDDMRVGDEVLIYHSSCEVPGVYGLAKVSHLAEPDAAQFDRKSKYFDAKARRESPRWYGVRVRFSRKLKSPVSLSTLRADGKLKDLFVFKNGRLSIGPLSRPQYERILAHANKR